MAYEYGDAMICLKNLDRDTSQLHILELLKYVNCRKQTDNSYNYDEPDEFKLKIRMNSK